MCKHFVVTQHKDVSKQYESMQIWHVKCHERIVDECVRYANLRYLMRVHVYDHDRICPRNDLDANKSFSQKILYCVDI